MCIRDRSLSFDLPHDGDGGPPDADVLYGPLPGEDQTVPRAELYAVLLLLRNRPLPYTIHSDSAYVVQNFHKLMTGLMEFPETHWDLWSEVLALARAGGPGGLKIVKVKGHATTAERQRGVISDEDFIGNDRADKYARLAAQSVEVPYEFVQELHELDRNAVRIFRRVAAVVRFFASTPVDVDRVCVPPPRATRAFNG